MTVRRPGILLAATASAALILAACGGDDEEPAGTDTGSESGDGGDGGSDGESVTLNFTWWGNDDRADRYNQSLELFAEEHPNIEVQANFASWDDYWPARGTEAAGGALPDVMQMDLSYLRQYQPQLMAMDDLAGSQIDVSGFDETLLPSGQIDGSTYGLPVGTNAFALFYDPVMLNELGVEPPAENQTWDEYNDFMTEVSEAGASHDPQLYGGADYTGTFWIFIHKLRQEGKEVFTEDGQIAFTKDDLREWWNSTAELRENNVTFPTDRDIQLDPLGPFAAAEAASEMSWDNFLAGYLADSGAEELAMQPIPSDDPDNRGLFLKPSMLLSIAGNSEHPEAAATLVDFLLNDPGVAEIFGTSKGLPASQAQRDAIALEGVDAQVAEYEDSISEYLSEAPPPPIEGFGTIEAAFLRIGQEIGLGQISVDDAVDQWFSEAEAAINQ